jgi:hypothetical protein
MNDFLKSHIQDATGREHPTRAEYKVLQSQVVKRLASLGMVAAESYYVKSFYSFKLQLKFFHSLMQMLFFPEKNWV